MDNNLLQIIQGHEPEGVRRCICFYDNLQGPKDERCLSELAAHSVPKPPDMMVTAISSSLPSQSEHHKRREYCKHQEFRIKYISVPEKGINLLKIQLKLMQRQPDAAG